MSTELESLIRPFQSGQISPAQTYYPAGQVGVPSIKLQIGRNGAGKTLSGSYSESQSFYCAKVQNEKPSEDDEDGDGGDGNGDGTGDGGGDGTGDGGGDGTGGGGGKESAL